MTDHCPGFPAKTFTGLTVLEPAGQSWSFVIARVGIAKFC